MFGAWGQQLLPGQTSAPSLGLVPVEAWILAGVLYAVLAALAVRAPNAYALLGLPRQRQEPDTAEGAVATQP